MAWKMPTIGAGRHGFLGLETHAGRQLKRAEKQEQRAKQDIQKLAPGQAAQQSAIAQRTAATTADLQAQQEELAAAALSGTGVQAGALRGASADLAQQGAETKADVTAQVAAEGQEIAQAKVDRFEANTAEAEKAKLASDQRLTQALGMGAAVVGTIVGGPTVGLAVNDIINNVGGVKRGTTDSIEGEDDEEEEKDPTERVT